MASKSYNRPMTQEEYLKSKYLAPSDYEESKSKKKRRKITEAAAIKNSTVKMIDDDINLQSLRRHDSDEEDCYFATAEMKPAVAGVIDDRPLHKQTASGGKVRSKWKKVGQEDDNELGGKSDTLLSIKEEPSDRTITKTKAKTLGGKRAGLSNAREIKKELVELKKKNDRLIENLSDDVSGKNARTVFRDRATGKIRDLDAELAVKQKAEEEKAQKEAEKKATYDQWSKGLTQRKQEIEKFESDLHEMSKPLARYEDDTDLDQHLRVQDRLDDPMLIQLRKKKEEEEQARNPNLKIFPKYKGPPAPPNRFNLQPGYRWDGVNRSNGYEAKIFAKVANRESNQEEAYRWSTQDM